ncbi:MAG: lipopolysaccharide kinase InaA family protein [Prevotella sp.]|nr:lipopolysaccharide kinase InaA family protein [Prevotella sp.]
MKITIDKKYSHLEAQIRNIPIRIINDDCDIVYRGRNIVARMDIGGRPYMVKQYKRVNVIQQVAYTFFCKTKAERAFLFAQEFERRGIETPTAVAYMEVKEHGLFTTGYLVTEEAEGEECHLLLREVEHYDTALADAVAAQVVRMHKAGVLHGDLNLSNFLVTPTADGWHFVMIDINRSSFRDGTPSDDECLANLVRITHRRDLYEYLISSYAKQRGWPIADTVAKALHLLDKFEHRRLKL